MSTVHEHVARPLRIRRCRPHRCRWFATDYADRRLLQRHRYRWTTKERWLLDDLLHQGCGYVQIAQRLRRSPNAVMQYCRDQGLLLTKIPSVLTLTEVAERMGCASTKRVNCWIERGWLAATNGARPPRVIWRIQETALWDIVENRHSWMAWAPHEIADPELGTWATELRRGQPRWLMVSEVAARYCVAVHTAKSWVDKHQLPATKYGSCWWIWESDLVGFVMPGDRPYRKLIAQARERKRRAVREAARTADIAHMHEYLQRRLQA